MTSGFKQAAPFPKAAPHYLEDAQLRANLRAATTTIRGKRDRLAHELSDFEQLRAAAAAIKDDAQSRLDDLLVQLEASVQAAGGHVHFAASAEEANQIIVQLAQDTGAKDIVKVKSMTSAETDLNQALAAVGADVVETDLAELIVQLGEDLPSHIVVPAIHRNRSEVRDIFRRRMGGNGAPALDDLSDSPAALAAAARAHLRKKFFQADMAISGANFLIADSGSVVVVESEGNGRMCLTLAPVLVSIAGIDKVLPTFRDLEVFLQLLARSATGERMNPYTSIWRGVTAGDGPQEFHLVLLDNGRTAALADPVGRQALRCIRCAACLNVCPVYERTGGHAYGSVYPGPIGAVLTPQLQNVASGPVAAALPFASTLCGACYEVCPVRIDIPRLLVHLRARSVSDKLEKGPTFESVAMAVAGAVMASPLTMARAERLGGKLAGRLFPKGRTGPLPGPLRAWTDARDAPVPAAQPFRDWWESAHGSSEAQGPTAGPTVPGGQAERARIGVGHVFKALAPGRLRRPRPTVPGAAPGLAVPPGTGGAAPAGAGAGVARANVLAAIRHALATSPLARQAVPRSYRQAGEAGVENPVDLFVQRVSEYKAGAVVVRNEEVPIGVAGALGRLGSKRVIVPADFPPEWLPEGEGVLVQRDSGELQGEELERFDATITACAVAVAETGTIVLDAGAGQGRRALSLVPDHLVVVVEAGQVVGNVPDAVAQLGQARLQTWISGPSATSDIELSRVEGVHGPRNLDVIVVAPR